MYKDLWLLGYEMVTQKMGELQKPFSPNAEHVDGIVRTLFSGYHVRVDVHSVEEVERYPLLAMTESEEAVPYKKQGGALTRGYPKVYKLVINYRPYLKKDMFPLRSKMALVALISRGKVDIELKNAREAD